MTGSAAFDGVVGDDGSLIVSPDQIARLGLQPGAHLRVVPAERTLDDILESVQNYQREQGIPEVSEEEAMAQAVATTREVRKEIQQIR